MTNGWAPLLCTLCSVQAVEGLCRRRPCVVVETCQGLGGGFVCLACASASCSFARRRHGTAVVSLQPVGTATTFRSGETPTVGMIGHDMAQRIFDVVRPPRAQHPAVLLPYFHRKAIHHGVGKPLCQQQQQQGAPVRLVRRNSNGCGTPPAVGWQRSG